ncbi:MAG: DMT family transporter [Bacteroidales bacterium]|nr:DMT family transporter [Bacteroidales bacterium]MBN2757363.1 DMT family transporter [Bacteroidales bacterium]
MIKSNKIIYTYLALIVAMFFWGLSFIWSKILLDFYNPITIVFLRLIISSIFLITIGLTFKKLQRINKNDILNLLLLSFFQPFLYFVGETFGLKYVSSTTASVLIATIPLFAPIAAYYFLKEKLSLLNFIGILISIGGILLVLVKEDFKISASPIGMIFMFLAVTSAIAYSVLVVKTANKYNVYTIITFQNFIGIFLFLPFFLYFDLQHFMSVKLSFELVKPLIYLSVFASSLAFMLFTYGIQVLGITKANTIANIIPVFTAVFAYFLLDEKLSPLNIFGIAIVISGLFLSQLNKKLHLKNIIIPFRKEKPDKNESPNE